MSATRERPAYIELPDGFTAAKNLTLEELKQAEKFAREQENLRGLRNVQKWIRFRKAERA